MAAKTAAIIRNDIIWIIVGGNPLNRANVFFASKDREFVDYLN